MINRIEKNTRIVLDDPWNNEDEQLFIDKYYLNFFIKILIYLIPIIAIFSIVLRVLENELESSILFVIPILLLYPLFIKKMNKKNIKKMVEKYDNMFLQEDGFYLDNQIINNIDKVVVSNQFLIIRTLDKHCIVKKINPRRVEEIKECVKINNLFELVVKKSPFNVILFSKFSR